MNVEDADGAKAEHLLSLKVKRQVAVETQVCYLSPGQGPCRQLQLEPPGDTLPTTLVVTSSLERGFSGRTDSARGTNNHDCVRFVLKSDDELACPL